MTPSTTRIDQQWIFVRVKGSVLRNLFSWRHSLRVIPNRWLGVFVWLAPRRSKQEADGYLPRLPALRMCGGSGRRVDNGLGRAVRAGPTEADGDEDARGNRRAKFAV